MGGEIIEVVADGLSRQLGAELAALEGIRAVRRISHDEYDELRLTVDDAGPAIPRILEILTASSVDVKRVQEYRPNFDEIFVKLMEQVEPEPDE